MRDPNYKLGNVYFAVRNDDGSYSEPVSLDSPVEIGLTSPEEHDPWLPRDSESLTGFRYVGTVDEGGIQLRCEEDRRDVGERAVIATYSQTLSCKLLEFSKDVLGEFLECSDDGIVPERRAVIAYEGLVEPTYKSIVEPSTKTKTRVWMYRRDRKGRSRWIRAGRVRSERCRTVKVRVVLPNAKVTRCGAITDDRVDSRVEVGQTGEAGL